MEDAEAQERLTGLWVDHHEQVTRFVARRVAPELVDDVVSEAFLVAWRRLDDVPADPRPWLFGVARNVLATHLRTHGRWRALTVRIEQQPTPTQEGTDDVAADRADLRQAWELLSDGDREVIALVAWDGLTTVEAARVLGCRPTTFSVRLTRARKRLLAFSEVPSETAEVLQKLQEAR
ncbi:RNA polymerase sigma-70 factor (ECF subfamily) [Isoptericola sp. CG 20/1183]|uniref:RNA polymerase sigma-70 factor (ECF subfamily) n=1 Tax=Isoptericola halotolerans TaxID=300560 RepID=A0ABX5EJE4_9MICO|nr:MULTISPECIES: sigma-70 family RNA polymerase sigma factor [Isoptericola]MCK0118445.1 sigma-70 family RNA polymerase sigma factor [Isoptericola sp. S6320L]PRZ08641.1 RNA polymerase sigma-70 factor (ECF subfamily) [Isoptericola halotolerans]PRZ10912.1 RNA polymerase sigma-70 factor (ECF subfamily) [Isoptericola sp. CG 20/1183]